ncbi:MAG TPA: SpoIID/LytB domain-containing protein [Tepidisphaeraceae bacterium]|nr:SpoIID/LytB domain-containing protein [Tepidisphaeraceae bacterium]
MRKPGLGTFLLLCLSLIPAGCATTPTEAPVVRVRILADQDRLTLAATTPPAVKSAQDPNWVRIGLPSTGGAILTRSATGWQIGNASFNDGELLLQPAIPGSLSVNGSAYRGRYRLVPTSANRFDVINDVDVDSYLMSVVSSEMPRDWHPEAYKAQAIVARTYALYEVHAGPAGRSFDLHDDQRSQVYGGISAETARSRSSVEETSGIVVAFGPRGNEKIFKAYFSSCCGGVGQSAYDAFGDPDIPPLRAKRVGALCSASPRFNWTISMTKADLTRRIREWGASHKRPEKDMGMLRSIDISGISREGRPVRFVLSDARGIQYALNGEELRSAINAAANGGPLLSSDFYRPVATPDAIQFADGHGWGHAVGMCQWCAQAMALKGEPHEQIVRFSYPGAVLVRAY